MEKCRGFDTSRFLRTVCELHCIFTWPLLVDIIENWTQSICSCCWESAIKTKAVWPFFSILSACWRRIESAWNVWYPASHFFGRRSYVSNELYSELIIIEWKKIKMQLSKFMHYLGTGKIAHVGGRRAGIICNWMPVHCSIFRNSGT